MPFQCLNFHHTGHVLAQCPRHMGGKCKAHGWNCFGVLEQAHARDVSHNNRYGAPHPRKDTW